MKIKDYSNLGKDELLRIIEKLQSRRRYGLVWDEENTKEKFEKDSQNALPVLKEIKSKEIKTDSSKSTNILIEGDNYHALSVLNYTHCGKVDIIYIDPPYNRNGDFKYNDNYVDKDDPYKHSKWLSFMKKRLQLAKNLLSSDGIMFISIDDNEVAQLKMLLDNHIFSESLSIGPIIWQKASGGGSSKKMVKGHEYILCYGNKNTILTQKNYKHDNMDYENSKKYLKKNGEWFFINDDVVRKYFGKYPKGTERRCEYEDLLKYKDNDYKKKIDENIKKGIYILKPNPKNNRKNFICSLEKINGLRMVMYSIIQSIFNAEGKDDLVADGLSEQDFDYPKPVKLIKLLIDSVGKKDAVVLDFFAGSGSTSKSVLELNVEDNGQRQFILCTNNEDNICTGVTYPRIKNITRGHSTKSAKTDGLGGNLKYFKTSFVKKSSSADDMKMKITLKCTEMLCLRESIFNEVVSNKDYRIFEQHGRIMCIYYALERNSLTSLKKKLDKMVGDKILYCFTLDPLGLNDNEFDDWHNVILEPIPQKILEIYRHIYEY